MNVFVLATLIIIAGAVTTRWGERRRHYPPPPLKSRGAAPDLAAVLMEVAGRVRAGAEPSQAWRQAVQNREGIPQQWATYTDFTSGAPTVDRDAKSRPWRLRRGDEDADAQRHLAAARAALGLANTLGAPLAEMLETAANSLVDSAEAQAERVAALAGPRATARVLSWLPVVGAVAATALGVDLVSTLVGGGIGSASLICGIAMFAGGRAWIRSLVRAAAHEEG